MVLALWPANAIAGYADTLGEVESMTAPDRRNEARIECRQCGFPLGRLSRDRRHPEFTPGLWMVVDTTLQRVEIICPRCGTRRSFTDIVFAAMAIPKIPTDAKHVG